MDTKTLLQDGDIQTEQGELIFDPYNSNNNEITEKCALPRPVLEPKAPPLASKTRLTTVLVKAYLT